MGGSGLFCLFQRTLIERLADPESRLRQQVVEHRTHPGEKSPGLSLDQDSQNAENPHIETGRDFPPSPFVHQQQIGSTLQSQSNGFGFPSVQLPQESPRQKVPSYRMCGQPIRRLDFGNADTL